MQSNDSTPSSPGLDSKTLFEDAELVNTIPGNSTTPKPSESYGKYVSSTALPPCEFLIYFVSILPHLHRRRRHPLKKPLIHQRPLSCTHLGQTSRPSPHSPRSNDVLQPSNVWVPLTAGSHYLHLRKARFRWRILVALCR